MAPSQITEEMRKFLADCNLLPFKEKLHDEGISRVEDIEDVTISTWKDLGVTDTQQGLKGRLIKIKQNKVKLTLTVSWSQN